MKNIIEISLFINLFINSFIINLTALFLRKNIKYWILSSFFGAVIAVIFPLFSLSIFCKIILGVSVASIIICISFKMKSFKEFLYILFTFVFATFLFGGGCYALENLIGEINMMIVCLCCSVIFLTAKVILKINIKSNIIKNFTYSVRLKDGEKIIDEEGFLDSGNMLYDNITQKPVILITYEVFHKLYENISLLEVITKSFDEKLVKNGHYIKIKGIGSGTSIFTFTIDEMLIGESKMTKNVMLGVSFSGFEKSFGKNILLHSEVI